MTIEDFKKQLKGMTTEELVELHKNVRRNRRMPINKNPSNKRKSKSKTSGLINLLKGLSEEERAEMIAMLEEGSDE